MKNSLKIFMLSLILLAALASPSLSQPATVEARTGSINVYSKIGFLKVYFDNKFVGETPIEAGSVQIGTHLVTATRNDETVYEQIVTIKEGEVTTILVSEVMKKLTTSEASPGKETEKKSEPHSPVGAIYGKIGYISSDNFKYPDLSTEHYASSLQYGAGYKIYLSQNVGILLDISRADFADPDMSWYIAPLTINLQLGYPIAPGSSGLYYYQLGIGYYFTNLKSDTGKEVSCIGYNLATGIEFPIAAGSVFLETSYGVAENSAQQFNLSSVIVDIGYRMNVQ